MKKENIKNIYDKTMKPPIIPKKMDNFDENELVEEELKFRIKLSRGEG